MRKSLILAALVLISAGCFAQKNPLVKKAKSLINAETPDFNAARAAILEALDQEPTAETYYWAGMVGYKEAMRENYNQMMGGAANIVVEGAAVEESYEYWLKADELAQVPVLNKKGVEVPTDPKMRGKLAKMMLDYYKGMELVKYGVHLNESRDFAAAYKAFRMHIDIPDLAMMQDEKLQNGSASSLNMRKCRKRCRGILSMRSINTTLLSLLFRQRCTLRLSNCLSNSKMATTRLSLRTSSSIRSM